MNLSEMGPSKNTLFGSESSSNFLMNTTAFWEVDRFPSCGGFDEHN